MSLHNSNLKMPDGSIEILKNRLYFYSNRYKPVVAHPKAKVLNFDSRLLY